MSARVRKRGNVPGNEAEVDPEADGEETKGEDVHDAHAWAVQVKVMRAKDAYKIVSASRQCDRSVPQKNHSRYATPTSFIFLCLLPLPLAETFEEQGTWQARKDPVQITNQ